MPKFFFVNISIARNFIIPSFSFKKSLRRDSQDPLLRWKGALCFYHIILYFSAAVIISGYALENQSLRDVGLSFDHDTRVLHMIIRYLASPSVYSFSHFGSSTLGSPKHRVDAICGSILGCLVPSSLASPTNRVNHRISDTWLSPSIPAIPGPQWHFRGI